MIDILDREEREEKKQMEDVQDGELAIGIFLNSNLSFLQSHTANDVHNAVNSLVFGRFLEKNANF